MGGEETRRGRGQSSPIALVLVFALVIGATTIVVVFSAGAIQSSQDQLGANTAENALTQLDSQASLVALGSSDVHEVSLSSSTSSQYRVVDSGYITVEANGSTIISEQLGAVLYEDDSGTTVAYQGGGVWRADGDNSSVMVSPPELHYREETLTLPLVTVDGDNTISNSAIISANSSTQVYPNETQTNPLEGGRTTVTVQSEYYQAWGAYFETRTSGGVSYNHAADSVTLTLVTPVEQTTVTSAASSLSASGTFTVSGSAAVSCGDTLYANSYNSSDTGADYCTQESNGQDGTEGDIIYGSDVDISTGSGTSYFYGNVVSGGITTVSGSGCGGQPCVYGNINYTESCDTATGGPSAECEDAIVSSSGGSDNQISGVDTVPQINSLVSEQIAATDEPSENDNSDTTNISTSNQFVYDADDNTEVGAGTYYVTNMNPTGDETILLNTTNGDVTVVVQENIYLERNTGPGPGTTGDIEVTGEGGVANVYIGGTGGNSDQLQMDRNGRIFNDGDDAPQFQLYGRDNLTAEIGEGQASQPAIYVGAIYAPPGASGSGRVDINGGEVFGGVLTGTTTLDGGSIHYDEALQDTNIVGGSETLPDIQYIHASVNRVNVTAP